jgi:hypothetical protein
MESTLTEEAQATFTVPRQTLERFLSAVPENRLGEVVAEMMRAEADRREAALIAACETVNADPEMAALEADFQALPDTMDEPWRG